MVIKLIRDPDYKWKIVIPVVKNVKFRNWDFTPAKALLIIDDVIIDYKGDFKLDPDEIKSFSVLKNNEATRKYGEKGKDGVIEITTYGNKTGSAGKKRSGSLASDSSKYKTLLSINHVDQKGEIIDIPVSNIQYISEWTYHDLDKTVKKGLR